MVAFGTEVDDSEFVFVESSELLIVPRVAEGLVVLPGNTATTVLEQATTTPIEL